MSFTSLSLALGGLVVLIAGAALPWPAGRALGEPILVRRMQHETAPPTPPAPSVGWRIAGMILALAIAIGMACVAYHLFTRNNDFPISYHPDERSKVQQIASQDQARNLRHPLLMLETANLLREWWGVSPQDELQLAITGRSASALLASIGVFCLAMTGFVRYRFVGLLLVGSSAALCPPLLVLAHYMKEDASLVGGLGVALLGAALMLTARSSSTQFLAVIVLAVGCAAAASGKYVGAALVAPALLALSIARAPRRWVVPSRLILFVATSVVAFVALNARAFTNPWTLTPVPRAVATFVNEFEHGITQHVGLHLETPTLFCLRTAARDWQLHHWLFALLGLGVGLASLIRRRAGVTRWGLVSAGFLVTFTIVLLFDAIPFARYALPITVLGCALSACAISSVIVSLSRRSTTAPWRTPTLLTCLALTPILALQAPRCLAFNRQFRDDSRERLAAWIAEHVPPNTRIVADSLASLDYRGDSHRFPDRPRMRASIMSFVYASDGGSLPQLARSGVQYIVAAEPSYQRFFVSGVVAVEAEERKLESRRGFYTSLFERGKLVWSSKPSPPSGAYVDPQLRLYDISAFMNEDSSSRPTPSNRGRGGLRR